MTANRKYKLLLLSSSDKLNTSLLSLLSDSSFEIVKVSAQAEAARRFLAAASVDIVIINTPLADESGLRLAAELCTDGSRGVLVFVRAAHFAEVSLTGFLPCLNPSPRKSSSSLCCSCLQRTNASPAPKTKKRRSPQKSKNSASSIVPNVSSSISSA